MCQTVELREVLQLDLDKVPVNPAQTYEMAGVLSFGRGLFGRESVSGSATSYKFFYRLAANQLVMSQLFGWEGALALSTTEYEGKFVSPQFPTFSVLEDRMMLEYLGWLVRWPTLWRDLGTKTKGMGDRRRTLNPNALLSTRIPLPPIQEQRRIVARIEELAAKVEEARRLRREAIWEATSLTQAAALAAFAAIGDAAVCPIEAIGEVRGGIQKSSARLPGPNPRRYITVAHVQRNRIDTGDPRYFEVTDLELERWRLMPGDVLVIEGNGSADQVGRTALFRGEIQDCVHQNHVIRIRPNRQRIEPEYLNAFFNSPAGRDQILERSRTTSGLFNLSVGRIKSIEVPVPSLERQQQIVAHLNGFQDKLESIGCLQSETAAELDALLPSILDKAFKGELI